MRINYQGLILSLFLNLFAFPAVGIDLPLFDFTTSAGSEGWKAADDISKLDATPEGLVIRIAGADPYMVGPARNYPAGTNLWLHLRLKSDQSGICQIFYYRGAPSEANSVRFDVPSGQWQEAQVPMPALGPGFHLRVDPPGSGGVCVLERLWFSERIRLSPPSFPKPAPFLAKADALTVQSGALKLIHNRDSLGSFSLQVAEQSMAAGYSAGLIGYFQEGQPRWFSLTNAPTLQKEGNGFVAALDQADPDGAHWKITQLFTPSASGAIDVETSVTVDRERRALFFPMLALFPGLGSFGTNKAQAVFPGLEYLENEPSSSEADIVGPQSHRQVPDTVKVTFPVMAVQAEGRYLGLIWEPKPSVCPDFDSPDRLLGSGAHLMGILFPGSDGKNREEGSLIPYGPELLPAKKPLMLRATLIGGLGTSVVPALQQYVSLRGLPAIPNSGFNAQEYFKLAAHGWLDSKIREGDLFRHAAAQGFGAQPSADAAVWMQWLAGKVEDEALAARLTKTATAALGRVSPANLNGTQVGHVRYPLPSLLFGSVAANTSQSLAHGRGLLGRFQPDGSVLYPPQGKGVDYAKTHWSREANGYTATLVAGLLDAAVFSGDRDLLEKALHHLRAMEKFKDTVPRGAQTWEVPLHTPDILASAYLLRAYTLGYEVTGDTNLLEHARYWAWTGLPFVYLAPPVDAPVGCYSTIAVFGATGWTAPVWMGLPVQWCGLVYGDALYRFARHDPAGPWKQLADGIAVAGIQHTWPVSDLAYQGLLPDSFQLRAQVRSGPAINPATLQPSAIRFYQQPPVYTFEVARKHGWLLHAAGEIRDLTEEQNGISFRVRGWSEQPTWLLINGIRREPRVQIDGKDVTLASPHEYVSAAERLILLIQTQARIHLEL